MQFNDRLATLTSVVNDSKSDLDAALTDLSTAVGEVQRFIAGTRNQTSEQIARLADVTQNLVDHHMALENILHAAPNAFGNFFNDYNADTGTIVGGFGLMNMANPTWGGQVLLSTPGCTQIGAVENITAVESGKLCSLFLGPGLRQTSWNNSPIPINPFIAKSIDPGRVLYTEPRLAPGGEGPKPGPPEIPPAVSAYTGLPGDPVGPPGAVPPERIPGAAMPLPPPPSTPMPPPPAPTVSGMLLPDRRATTMIARVAARRVFAIGCCVVVTATGCAFHGLNSLPLPGAVGRGPGANIYHVELPNVGTMESNSPVMIDDVVVGSVGEMRVQGWHADVEISVKRDVVVPANVVATVGQTSLLGSMHVELNTPLGPAGKRTAAAGRHHPAEPVIGLSRRPSRRCRR